MPGTNCEENDRNHANTLLIKQTFSAVAVCPGVCTMVSHNKSLEKKAIKQKHGAPKDTYLPEEEEVREKERKKL